ncbi:S-layer homology domain-containing protein [Paenibacillus sp. D51F]
MAFIIGAPWLNISGGSYGSNQQTAFAEEAGPSPAMQLVGSATLGATVTDLVYDQGAGSVYALTKDNNKLTFLDAGNLAVQKELSVGSMPTDMELYGNHLYIALSGAMDIAVVDLTSRTVSAMIETTYQPQRIAVTSEYIFYTTSLYQWCEVYKQDRATGQTTMLIDRVSGPGLKVDEGNHILYAGETGSSGSHLYAIDYLTGQQISKSTYDGNYGFGFPTPNIFLDNENVLYAGTKLNGRDLSEIKGMYPRLDSYTYLISKLQDANGSLVATSEGVFDKDRYLPVARFPYEAGRAVIGNGNAFIVKDDYYTKTLEAYAFDPSGALPTISLNKTTNYSTSSNYPIDSWTTDAASPYLYAVSSVTNELAVLNKHDLSLVSKQYVGSKPLHIQLHNGKLYIAFEGETSIGVLDAAALGSGVNRIRIPSNPSRVLPAGTVNVFYWGQDTFNNFHVTDGTTDRQVMGYPNSTNFGQAAYDLSDNALYTYSNGQIIKMNPDTLGIASSIKVDAGYGYNDLHLDSSSLYLGSKRYNKSNPARLLGSYPENILYVSGDLAFGKNNVYDKDTYVKKLALPFEINDAYVDSDGSIYLSTPNSLYRFEGIQGIQSYMDTELSPSNLVFAVDSYTSNMVSGTLYFKPARDVGKVQGYAPYFMDADGNKLNYISGYMDKKLDDGTMTYKIYYYDVPEKAEYIGLYSYLSYSDPQPQLKPAKTMLWDIPAFFAAEFGIQETSSADGYVQGTVAWKAGKEKPNLTYSLYFVGENGLIGGKLAEVAGGKSSYSVAVGKTKLPESAVGLALVQQSGDYEAPIYQFLILERFISPSIPEGDVALTKYLYASDLVKVKNVKPGDMITLYNSSYLSFSTTRVPAGTESITIQTGNMGSPGTKIYITRKRPGLYESDPTPLVIPEIINDGPTFPGGTPKPTTTPTPSASPSPSPSSTPTSDGGTGGSFPGGFGGFPGVVATPTPSPTPASDKLQAVESKDGSGKVYTSLDVSAAHLSGLMGKNEFLSKGTVTLASDSKSGKIVFSIEASGVQKLQEKKGSLFIFETPSGSWSLPATALALTSTAGTAQRFEISFEQLNDSDAAGLRQSGKGNPVGKPVKFTASVTAGGATREIGGYSQYVQHVLKLDAPDIPASQLGAYAYDASSKSFIPVPARYSYSNGMLTATIYGRTGTVYAVARLATSFTDLPASAEYSQSIKTLASRTILSGYPGGTFKPEGKVTRAEFAAMLSKALGMTPDAISSKTSFTDAKPGSWYDAAVKQAVQAGIINGYPDGSFKPNHTISHQEMLAMLVKAMQYAGYAPASASGASGVSVPDWAKTYYEQAMGSGLIGQKEDVFHYSTAAEASRKESALLLDRLVNGILFQ